MFNLLEAQCRDVQTDPNSCTEPDGLMLKALYLLRENHQRMRGSPAMWKHLHPPYTVGWVQVMMQPGEQGLSLGLPVPEHWFMPSSSRLIAGCCCCCCRPSLTASSSPSMPLLYLGHAKVNMPIEIKQHFA